MTDKNAQALEALKHALVHYEAGNRVVEIGNAIREAIAALESSAPSAAEPVGSTLPVERAWLESLKARVNTLAVLSLKTERWSLAIDIKQSIADVLAAPPAPQAASEPVATQAARDVLGERQRQISAEGWTPEHDEGEMAMAAAGYAVKASDQIQCVAHGFDESTLDDDVTAPQPGLDPWPHAWGFKPCPPRRALVKAGALILAEIERLDRAAPTPSKGEA